MFKFLLLATITSGTYTLNETWYKADGGMTKMDGTCEVRLGSQLIIHGQGFTFVGEKKGFQYIGMWRSESGEMHARYWISGHNKLEGVASIEPGKAIYHRITSTMEKR